MVTEKTPLQESLDGWDAVLGKMVAFLDSQQQEIDRLRAINAELLAALEACIKHINFMGRALNANDALPDYIPQLDDAERVSFAAEAAIARARGGAL